MKFIKINPFYIAFIMLFLSTNLNNSYAQIHEFTGLPMSNDGWTDLQLMFQDSSNYSDSRIVYVSNAGNNNTAQIYNAGDVAVSG
ncbi:MAG: hypothetical protein JEY91_11905, partial [Spirochaetaceae bacterium]|nr:hypothetical protein [Spirochaetaceae bacterium]